MKSKFGQPHALGGDFTDTRLEGCLFVGGGYHLEGKVTVPGELRVSDFFNSYPGDSVEISEPFFVPAEEGLVGNVSLRLDGIIFIVPLVEVDSDPTLAVKKKAPRARLHLSNGWWAEGTVHIATESTFDGLFSRKGHTFIALTEVRVTDRENPTRKLTIPTALQRSPVLINRHYVDFGALLK